MPPPRTALARMVETLAEEVRDDNVQVNCMAPGGAYTHMTDQILHAGERAGWKAQEEALEMRVSGASPPRSSSSWRLFPGLRAHPITQRKLIHVNDDWKRLETSNVNAELYTLRASAEGLGAARPPPGADAGRRELV